MNLPCDPEIRPSSPDDIDHARCVLEAGRDRTAGRYRVTLNTMPDGDPIVKTTSTVNLGDGFASTVNSNPDPGDELVPTRHALKPKSFFEDCLASSDGKKILGCVLDMHESAAVAGAVCAP